MVSFGGWGGGGSVGADRHGRGGLPVYQHPSYSLVTNTGNNEVTFGIGVQIHTSDLSSWQSSSVLIYSHFPLFPFLPSALLLLLIISKSYNDISSMHLLLCKLYVFTCTHTKLLMRVLWVGVLSNLGVILQKWLSTGQ